MQRQTILFRNCFWCWADRGFSIWLIGSLLTLSIAFSHEASGAARSLNNGEKITWDDRVGYGPAHALLIGIDDYKYWPRLKFAKDDVSKLEVELKKHGYQIDKLATPEKLDRRTIENRIEDFLHKKGDIPDVRLFIWFAGHGYTTKNGEGYLVPNDVEKLPDYARSKPLKGRDRHAFLKRAVSMRLFDRLLRESNAPHIFIVVDACFAGTIFKPNDSGTNQLTKGSFARSHHFLAAGEADQEVFDNGKFQNLFVRAIGGLEPKADRYPDGFVTANELGKFLLDEIKKVAPGQTPVAGVFQSGTNGKFVFKIREPEIRFGRLVLETYREPNENTAYGLQVVRIEQPSLHASFKFETPKGKSLKVGDIIKVMGTETGGFHTLNHVGDLHDHQEKIRTEAKKLGRFEVTFNRGMRGYQLTLKLPTHHSSK